MNLPPVAGPEREAAILNAALEFSWVPIVSEARGKRAKIWVSSDALKLDGVRVNVTATTAQRIADKLGAHLPTSRICDLAWEQAAVRCKPCLQTPDAQMANTDRMVKHSASVDAQVAGRSGLARTVGKDWILHPRLAGKPDLAVNYGWHDTRAPHLSWSGLHMWQTIGTRHNRHHTDYSQTLTLVSNSVEVDGNEYSYTDLLRHAELSWLLSDDGVMPVTRYPGVELWKLPAQCSPDPAWPPITLPEIKFVKAKGYNTGRRAPVSLVVLHTMEAQEKPTTAESVASWFAGPNAPQASAHYCVDSDSIVQGVLETDTAWAAPGANHNGIQIEMAGYARQNTADWFDEYSTRMLRLVAALTADICRRHSLPVEFVDHLGLKEGRSGITYHREVSKAFKRSTHTDPGTDFPLAYFLDMVRSQLA